LSKPAAKKPVGRPKKAKVDDNQESQNPSGHAPIKKPEAKKAKSSSSTSTTKETHLDAEDGAGPGPSSKLGPGT
jgi:hypothetical protein